MRVVAERGSNARLGRQLESVARSGASGREQPTGTLLGRVALWISIQAAFVVLALLITAALQSSSASGHEQEPGPETRAAFPDRHL